MARRLKAMGLPQYQNVVDERGWTGEIALVPDALDKPLRWRKPRRVFVGSMTDLFHENTPTEWTDEIFAVMGRSQQHTFQILTKRPDRMVEYLSGGRYQRILDIAYRLKFRDEGMCQGISDPSDMSWWPNVWLGTTTENQKAADRRVPYLLQTRAAVRFISAEPMLGPIELSLYLPFLDIPRWERERLGTPAIDWVIIGCESGPGRRPMELSWALDLVRQCQAAGVACFVKQVDIGGRVSHDPAEWPAALRVREYPGTAHNA